MKKLGLAILITAMCGLGISCSKEDNIDKPNQENTPPSEKVIKYFPSASSMVKEGSLTIVKDVQNQILGYILNSKPASDGITGRNGETPLDIIFDSKKVVNEVDMLPNQETESFVNIVVKCGLLESWNGLDVDAALAKNVDAISGATLTSNSVIKTFKVALQKNMK